MSSVTIASLRRLSRDDLFALLTRPTPPSLAVIDVRDSDHIGGHIRGSKHVPSGSLDYRLPELVRELKDTKVVVFHCALSQQRGPGAALRYLREKERLGPSLGKPAEDGEQEVMILDGGFLQWQEK
jgi:rhodanese-related sulfurtransferase